MSRTLKERLSQAGAGIAGIVFPLTLSAWRLQKADREYAKLTGDKHDWTILPTMFVADVITYGFYAKALTEYFKAGDYSSSMVAGEYQDASLKVMGIVGAARAGLNAMIYSGLSKTREDISSLSSSKRQ